MNVFAELNLAEHCFETYDQVGCAKALFRCAEFFWKSLTILSGNFFEPKHDVLQRYMQQISGDILSASEKAEVFRILTRFPDEARKLATHGYYEKGRSAVPPYKLFDKTSVEEDLAAVAQIVSKFRRIHYEQVFFPRVKVGVLSGYVTGAEEETPCTEYTWSPFKKAQGWVEDLNQMQEEDQPLLDANLINISDIPTSNCAIVINPFGETFPEKGTSQGQAFSTITEYIRNGGIFLSCAGHPFNYAWDVSVETDNRKTIVSSFPVVTGVEVREERGQPKVFLRGTNAIPPESLLVTRTFGASAAWDDIERGVHGPVEVEVSYSDILAELDEGKPLKIRAFRPLKNSEKVIPLLRANHPIWGEVSPAAAVAFGRGFLICFGMPLENQNEYDVRLATLKGLVCFGYKRLIKS